MPSHPLQNPAQNRCRGRTAKVVQGIKRLSDRWGESSDEYVPYLSNFKSYFLVRFNSDTQKNWHQVLAELFPYRPQRILDIGCGLGNWSLPFWLSGESKALTLNDVNQTIVKALNDGISSLPVRDGISIPSDNLLTMKEVPQEVLQLSRLCQYLNYLDPIDFFRFAQASVSAGGRMLLMLQTPAFNRLRYRLALESKDCPVAAEVLGSDFLNVAAEDLRNVPGRRQAYIPCRRR